MTAGARKRLRILFVIGSLREGGAEGQLVHLMEGLRAEGHDVALMLLHYEGVRLQEVLRRGFRVFPVRLPRFRPRWSPVPWLALPYVLGRSVRFVRRWQPDVLHAWLFWAHLWALMILFWIGPMPLITSRRQMTSDKGRSWLLLTLENLINRWSVLVISNSRRVAEQVRRSETFLPRQRVIYNGVRFPEASEAEPLPRLFPRLARAERIGITVANLLPHKGYFDLLHAWSDLLETHPRMKILCVGADGGLRSRLEMETRLMNLQEHVVFAGSRQDVPALLRRADFAVHASHDEGFSNAILEYMAAGLPIVATDVGGTSEALAEGRAGRLVPPRQPAELAQALRDLLDDWPTAQLLGRRARRRALRLFTMEAMLAQHLGEYHRVAEGPNALRERAERRRRRALGN